MAIPLFGSFQIQISTWSSCSELKLIEMKKIILLFLVFQLINANALTCDFTLNGSRAFYVVGNEIAPFEPITPGAVTEMEKGKFCIHSVMLSHQGGAPIAFNWYWQVIQGVYR